MRLDVVLLIGGTALAVGVVGASMVRFWYLDSRRLRASVRWPATQGKIVEAGVRETYRGIDMPHKYRPEVHYEYSVSGQTYIGKWIAFGGSAPEYTSRDKAEEVIAAYPEGKIVTVYYNPENPQEAVLERRVIGGKATLLAAFVMGIVFVFASVCCLAWLLYTLLLR